MKEPDCCGSDRAGALDSESGEEGTLVYGAESKTGGGANMQGFFAYPSDSVIAGLAKVVTESASSSKLTVIPWEENDVSGRPLTGTK